MTVIRGGNTIGKSLLVQSMLYALGLEALYSTRKGVLTRAMTTDLVLPTASGDEERTVPVIDSWVEVVVELDDAATITVRRAVKPNPFVKNEDDLVRVWGGDVFDVGLSERNPSEDYLIGRPGTAVQERGFHRFLTDRLGWQLPMVPTYNGRVVPLYLQEVFGLAYVDQKRGWGGTVPQVPTTFQIIDPLRKAVEYVLQLDTLKASVRRQDLTEQHRRLVVEVARVRGRLDAAASMHGGQLVIPPSENDGPAVPVIEILAENEWMSLEDRLETVRATRAARARATVARGEEAAEVDVDVAAMEQALAEAEEDLKTASAALASINQDDHDVSVQLGALQRRLNTLDEEYERYRQIDALRDLGSVIAPHTMDEGDCPTCHQSLDAVESIEGNALPVADTLEALRKDRATVRNLKEEVESRAARLEALQAAWTEQVSVARQRVRAAKTDLVAANGTPSARDIQVGLEQEQELARLSNLQATTGEDIETLFNLTRELKHVSAELKALERQAQSAGDKRRVKTWTEGLRRLLTEFDFTSVPPSDVDIDLLMRPVVDGYDIGFQGSASDGIRLRWSYLLSLAEAATGGGAHPGVLILDEPAQQGIETHSVVSLLQRMAHAAGSTQMFVTTSEPPGLLDEWLGDADYQLIDLGDDRVLQPLDVDESAPQR